MQNPWVNLPKNNEYVLPCDIDFIKAHNIKHENKNEFQYKTKLLPDPYVGIPNSPVLILMLNPGVALTDFDIHKTEKFKAIINKNLLHEIPFYYNTETIDCPGSQYWDSRLKFLYKAVGDKKLVQENIFMAQHIPYHSYKYKHSRLKLTSQEYTFNLIRSSIASGSVVLLMRSFKLWHEAIPELSGYDKVFEASSVLSTYLSSNNIKNNGFELVVDTILSQR